MLSQFCVIRTVEMSGICHYRLERHFETFAGCIDERVIALNKACSHETLRHQFGETSAIGPPML